jgi:hypothetical protein
VGEADAGAGLIAAAAGPRAAEPIQSEAATTAKTATTTIAAASRSHGGRLLTAVTSAIAEMRVRG